MWNSEILWAIRDKHPESDPESVSGNGFIGKFSCAGLTFQPVAAVPGSILKGSAYVGEGDPFDFLALSPKEQSELDDSADYLDYEFKVLFGEYVNGVFFGFGHATWEGGDRYAQSMLIRTDKPQGYEVEYLLCFPHLEEGAAHFNFIKTQEDFASYGGVLPEIWEEFLPKLAVHPGYVYPVVPVPIQEMREDEWQEVLDSEYENTGVRLTGEEWLEVNPFDFLRVVIRNYREDGSIDYAKPIYVVPTQEEIAEATEQGRTRFAEHIIEKFGLDTAKRVCPASVEKLSKVERLVNGKASLNQRREAIGFGKVQAKVNSKNKGKKKS